MARMINKRYDAYCGLYCGACEILLMNELGKIEEKAKEWNMDLNDVRCFGCKSEQNSIYCVDCYFKKCAESKEIDFCFQCNEFPCARLLEFKNDKFPHHSAVLKNLNMIKEMGCKIWLKNQESRWNCTQCGARFTWYAEKCGVCEEKLYNSRDEEKDNTEETSI